jgi:predicted nuclease of predicted toxin-antitoxin system
MAETARSLPDDFVLKSALQRKALLVTDDKDFGEMVFLRKKDSAGVLLIRLEGLSAKTKADMVSRVVHRHGEELLGAFSVVSHNNVRIRRRI